MEELRYQKVEEIKVDSKLVASAAFKPFKASIIIGIVGVGLMIINNLWVRILGAFFIAMSLFVFLMVKDKKTIDVYEKGVVIYKFDDQSYAYYLSFDDIEEWDVLHLSGHDTVEFTLHDKNKAVTDTFQTNKVYAALDKVIPEKNHIAIMAKRNKELNISPVDAIKNLVNRKK